MSEPDEPLRLVVVDDHPVYRDGLALLLGSVPGMAVVGTAADGAAAVALARSEQPDVVVMDVAMPGMDGIDATAALRSVLPHCAVVIHSLHDDAKTQARASAAGAAAFVAKSGPSEALLAAIRQASAHQA